MSRTISFFRSTALWIILLPYLVYFFGAASNQLVLWANNDTFPVKVNLAKAQHMAPDAIKLPDGTIMLDEVHCLMTPKTHLNILADNWDLNREGIWSIGDFLLDLGDWLGTFAPFVWGAIVVGKLRNAI